MTTAQELPNDPNSSPPDLEFTAAPPSPGAQPGSFLEPHRCQFTFSDGRRCANERAYLCVHHASKQRDPSPESAALDAPELVGLGSDLTSATSINRALTQVFLLMAQGRISQKQAVAFGYISQLLLQTLPGVRSEYVSVYDPNSWRAKIQASLERIEDDGCDESDHGRPAPSRLAQNKSDHPIRSSGESHQQDELSPVNKVIPSEQRAGPQAHADVARAGVGERGTSQYPRLSSAPAKRRARDFYGNPIPPADWWCSLPGADSAIQRPPQRPPQPETGKADLSLPRSDITPAGSTGASDRVIPADVKNSTPVATPSSQPKTRDALAPNRHTTSWFVPASWSGRPRPDPYPSGAAERRNKFRSLANSALRRIQHQNSRGFWSPDIKHLAT